MKRNTKLNILKRLSKSLEYFFPELNNHFMCPTCLRKIDIEKKHDISEAHIIPEKAGGKLKTFICRDCNSRFGTKQDKWFGELLNILNSEHSSIFYTAIKYGYFLIDGIKINGNWERDKGGGFEFHIRKDNSPEVKKLIEEKFSSHPPKINITIPLPLLENRKLVDVGFLTAGYLQWFNAYGYSWVLQSHLDPIREQILNPDKEIFKREYIFDTSISTKKPWYGLVPIDGKYTPVYTILKYMIAFPSRHNKNIYKDTKACKRDIKMADMKMFEEINTIYSGPPTMIIYEDEVIVGPDEKYIIQNDIECTMFTKDNLKRYRLTPVNDEECDNVKNKEGTIRKTITYNK